MTGNRWLRNSFAYLVILAAIAALFFTAFPQTGDKEVVPISLSGLAKDVRDGAVILNQPLFLCPSPDSDEPRGLPGEIERTR